MDNNTYTLTYTDKSSLRKMLSISQECDNCGKCAQACPFGALKITEEGDIMFRSLSCVYECEVCALVCEKKAINFTALNTCSHNCENCSADCAKKE